MSLSDPSAPAAPVVGPRLPHGLLALGVALALAGSAAVSWLQHRANVETRLAVEGVEHSLQVQLTTESLRRTLVGARAATLTYLLTGNLGEQDRASAALAEADAHARALLPLTADDPRQHAEARAVATMVQQRAELMRRLAATDPAQRAAASEALAANPDLLSGADALRLRLREIDLLESSRLDERRAEADREWRLNDTVLIATNFALLVALLALIYGAGHALLRRKLTAYEADLAAARASMQQVLEGMSDGFALLDRDWRCRYFNRALKQWIGPHGAAAIGQPLWQAFPQLRDGIVERQLKAAQHSGERVVYRHTSDDGRVAETRAYPLDQGLAIFVTDITEQARAAAEREAREQQLERLSRQLLEAQETERRAIARDLHDGVGQQLAALKLALRNLQRGVAAPTTPGDAVHLVEELIAEVRDRALELRPALLDDLGLVAALQWYCERESQRGPLPLVLHADAALGRLPPALETAAYRIVQEASRNAQQHALASRIEIALERRGDQLAIEVADDGVGFDPAAPHPTRAGATLGRSSLRERAELLGGRCTVDSTPGHGTRVHALLPLVQTPVPVTAAVAAAPAPPSVVRAATAAPPATP